MNRWTLLELTYSAAVCLIFHDYPCIFLVWIWFEMITTEEHKEHFVATFLVLSGKRRLLFKVPIFTSHLSSLRVMPLLMTRNSCTWIIPSSSLLPAPRFVMVQTEHTHGFRHKACWDLTSKGCWVEAEVRSGKVFLAAGSSPWVWRGCGWVFLQRGWIWSVGQGRGNTDGGQNLLSGQQSLGDQSTESVTLAHGRAHGQRVQASQGKQIIITQSKNQTG